MYFVILPLLHSSPYRRNISKKKLCRVIFTWTSSSSVSSCIMRAAAALLHGESSRCCSPDTNSRFCGDLHSQRLPTTPFSLVLCKEYVDQRKDIYIEHRAGKAPRLASWRKMTQPASFVGDVSFRGCPVCAHLPPPPPGVLWA